jgi:transposase-like protein
VTAPKSMNPAEFMREQAASASPDVLRDMVKTFADVLMSAEADAICGAAYGQRSSTATPSPTWSFTCGTRPGRAASRCATRRSPP